MKKILALVMILVMLLTAFPICSNAGFGDSQIEEIEDNNTSGEANAINSDCTVTGVLMWSDIDYFGFVLTEKTQVSFVCESDSKELMAIIKNENNETVEISTEMSTFTGLSTETLNCTLPAGKYYLVLFNTEAVFANEYVFYFNYNSITNHTHSYTISSVEPTCNQKGKTTYTCSCGDYYVGNLVDALSHDWVDGICTMCGQMQLPESEHSYANNTDEIWTLSKPGAPYGSITFSSNTYLEPNYDYIYIYDGSNALIGRYTGAQLASETVYFIGDTVQIRFTSDSSNTYYGFKVESVDFHNHYSAGSNVVTEATCATAGLETGVCDACDAYFENVIPMLEHNFGEWIITEDATCVADGSKYRECINCHEIENATIKSFGHNYIDYKCLICGEYTTVESPHPYENDMNRLWNVYREGATQLTITFSANTFVEPNRDFILLYDGNLDLIGKYTGDELANKTIIVNDDVIKIWLESDSANTAYGFKVDRVVTCVHEFDDWVIDEASTCTTTGVKHRVCPLCETVEEGVVDMLSHDYVDNYCTVCGRHAPVESPHPYANNMDETWVIHKEGVDRISIKFSDDTFVEDNYDFIYIYYGDDILYGKYTGSYLASKWAYIDSDTVKIRLTSDGNYTSNGFKITDINFHTHETSDFEVLLEPTCEEKGQRKGVCDTCNEEFVGEIPALGHAFGDWIIDVELTCTENGEKHKECTVCGYVEHNTTETLGHNYIDGFCINCGIEKIILNGWVEEKGKWAYYVDDVKLTNTWKKDSVGWCYLGEDGYMLRSQWVQDSVGWCYVNASGYMVYSKWIKDDNGWCYVNGAGYRSTNKWVKDSKGWCYVGADGYMTYNKWVKDSKGWCYVGANGYMVYSKWVKDSVGWCYVGANGYMTYNKWVKDSKGWCYVGSNGYMAVNKWVKYNGDWYYMNSEGYMTVDLVQIDGKIYYFNEDGTMFCNGYYGSAYVDGSGIITTANYVYLAEIDVTAERLDYPSTQVESVFMYAGFDNYDSFCVVTIINYQIGNYEYSITTLHDFGRNRTIEDPVNYYRKQADRVGGAEGAECLLLGSEAGMLALKALGEEGSYISGDYFN